MTNKVEHLYIHIPFCKSICSYCDFVRKVPSKCQEMTQYIDQIVKQINNECKGLNFKTIYIGGGTPNYLPHKDLEKLLDTCHQYLAKNYEFTIECNPEFINQHQINIFKKYGVNRISLGVQSTNNRILKLFNRLHIIEDAYKAIALLHQNNIPNISCDFIYGFKAMTDKDILDDIQFLIDNQIPHASFYSLELKENSMLTKSGYQLDDEQIDQLMQLIINQMDKHHFYRYEVSNWCTNKKYQCQHNLAYWKTNDWKGIGLGAYGLENKEYYSYVLNNNQLSKQITEYSNHDYYFQIIMMGLRLIEGLDLSIKRNQQAYNFFKKQINPDLIVIKNHHLMAKNINQIDDILIELV